MRIALPLPKGAYTGWLEAPTGREFCEDIRNLQPGRHKLRSDFPAFAVPVSINRLVKHFSVPRCLSESITEIHEIDLHRLGKETHGSFAIPGGRYLLIADF